MTRLFEEVAIKRRFQRAINISSDISDDAALEGFICPRSSQLVLENMAHQTASTGQAAFTWTGPYGSGKSSLAVALAGVLCGTEKRREANAKIVGQRLSKTLWHRLPPMSKGWKVIPIVGQRSDPANSIGQAISRSGFLKSEPDEWTSSEVVEAVQRISKMHPRSSGGLLLFIDEMGKYLEGAARDGHDIFLFQELAEAASRSNGRILFIGVLHQSFEEYASQLSRDLRDEWSKIQGRFVDLVIDSNGEEQLELLAAAISSNATSKGHKDLCKSFAQQIGLSMGQDKGTLAEKLQRTWPLHPIAACLLGPISRRRFGQNQRSIFGFLNSAEPHGFQQFLASANCSQLYSATQLWDYLRANLEPSILASPDGHRWAMAVEALERCESLAPDQTAVDTLKLISLIDLFKERSGLKASHELISLCLHSKEEGRIEKALEFLTGNSLVLYRKFSDAYGIYAGSDFDIEAELQTVLSEQDQFDLDQLSELLELHPILAKRHYHRTGALRWFDVTFAPVDALERNVREFEASAGTAGQIILAVPTKQESTEKCLKACRVASRLAQRANVIIGFTSENLRIYEHAREITALDQIRRANPRLAGDSVARREISSRLQIQRERLSDSNDLAMRNATWFLKNHQPRENLSRQALNQWISECCDQWYSRSPWIKNELLNRRQPSSNAVAAQNQLLRLMVLKNGEPWLGLSGFPAEAGLMHSILIRTKIYTSRQKNWAFSIPKGEEDKYQIEPTFQVATRLLKESEGEAISLDKIYEIWREPPFGIADGLLPILGVSFLLANQRSIAFYRDGTFRPEIIDVDVEILAKDPSVIELRWMSLSRNSKLLLAGLAQIIQELDSGKKMIRLDPLDVARELVSIHDSLPGWVKRTQRLSAKTLQLRRLLNQARDPNQFLFKDLPTVLQQSSGEFENLNIDELIDSVSTCLRELSSAYGGLIERLGSTLLQELDVPNASENSLSDLRGRAKNILDTAPDFLEEAFYKRLAEFEGKDAQIESLASLVAGKPIKSWVDQDVQKAILELASFSRRFMRAESFAHVHGRKDKRRAISVVVGLEDRQRHFLREFEVLESENQRIEQLSTALKSMIGSVNDRNINVVLAALAELTAEYLNSQKRTNQESDPGKAA